MAQISKQFSSSLPTSQTLSPMSSQSHRVASNFPAWLTSFAIFAIASFAPDLSTTALAANPLSTPVSQATTSTSRIVKGHSGEQGFFHDDDLFQAVRRIEQSWEGAYEAYFGAELSEASLTAEKIAKLLDRIGQETQQTPALIYLVPTPKQLEIVLITPGRAPIRKSIPQATRANVQASIRRLIRSTTNPNIHNSRLYLPSAQQLYQWLIAPIEADLEAAGVETLLFCMGSGLRSLPLAALHDGEQFLVEKFNFSLIPAFNMVEVEYGDIRDAEVLVMGASEFDDLPPLPAVTFEVQAIAPRIWQGKTFLNQGFTEENLQTQLDRDKFRIVHLATHADFQSGDVSNSYIQLWDRRLTLGDMRQLPLHRFPVELLVLSACRTAVGDPQAEMGFAGLAVNSGVKSAVASLWYVSDAGTLTLMTEFYQQLRQTPIKAEALRQAQIAMIRGETSAQVKDLLSSETGDANSTLPPELRELESTDLSHPFYWAAFTVVGSPW